MANKSIAANITATGEVPNWVADLAGAVGVVPGSEWVDYRASDPYFFLPEDLDDLSSHPAVPALPRRMIVKERLGPDDIAPFDVSGIADEAGLSEAVAHIKAASSTEDFTDVRQHLGAWKGEAGLFVVTARKAGVDTAQAILRATREVAIEVDGSGVGITYRVTPEFIYSSTDVRGAGISAALSAALNTRMREDVRIIADAMVTAKEAGHVLPVRLVSEVGGEPWNDAGWLFVADCVENLAELIADAAVNHGLDATGPEDTPAMAPAF